MNNEKIYFGSYPQTKVTEPTLINALNTSAGDLPTPSNSGVWQEYGYYNAGVVENYAWYIDVEREGNRYRGVYFTSYRPGDTISSFSNLEDSLQYYNGYVTGEVYWFKFEPIEWVILEKMESKVLIVAKNILDSQAFNPISTSLVLNDVTIYPSNWEHSAIRRWLNECFFEVAFNEIEKALILTTALDNKRTANERETGFNKYASIQNDVIDKVFLLSYKDVDNCDYGFKSNASRIKKATDYAKAQGVSACKDANNFSNALWKLRSPFYLEGKHVSIVSYDGNINFNCEVNRTCDGVVPALTLML